MAQITREQALKIIDMQMEELEALKHTNISLEDLEIEKIKAKENPSPNGLDTPLFDRIYGIEGRLTELAAEIDATPSLEFRKNNTVRGFIRKVTKDIPEGEFRLSDALRRFNIMKLKGYFEVKKENILFLAKISREFLPEEIIAQEFADRDVKKMKR